MKTKIIWESNQWIGKNIMRRTGEKELQEFKDRSTDRCDITEIMLKTACNPFPKRQILFSSKLKDFPDGNFNFDDHGRKFSKSVENIVGKGEIARYQQFLLFPRCFQKTCTADT